MSLFNALFVSILCCHIQDIFALEANQWHKNSILGKEYYYYTGCISGQTNMINKCQGLGGITLASIPTTYAATWFKNELITNPPNTSCGTNIAFGGIGTKITIIISWKWNNGDTWDSDTFEWHNGCGGGILGFGTYILFMNYSDKSFCDASINDHYSIICERDIIPTESPTNNPSVPPSDSPTIEPSLAPSKSPSISASDSPDDILTLSPSTISPSKSPTGFPSSYPSISPSSDPTIATSYPSIQPTMHPLTSANVDSNGIITRNDTKDMVSNPIGRDNATGTVLIYKILIIIAVIGQLLCVILCVIAIRWKYKKNKSHKEQNEMKLSDNARSDSLDASSNPDMDQIQMEMQNKMSREGNGRNRLRVSSDPLNSNREAKKESFTKSISELYGGFDEADDEGVTPQSGEHDRPGLKALPQVSEAEMVNIAVKDRRGSI